MKAEVVGDRLRSVVEFQPALLLQDSGNNETKENRAAIAIPFVFKKNRAEIVELEVPAFSDQYCLSPISFSLCPGMRGGI